MSRPLVIAAALIAMLAPQAAAAATPTVVPGTAALTLPSGGVSGYLGFEYPASTGGVACASGTCVAVGSYSDGSSNFPLTTTAVNGVFGTGTQVQYPAGASPTDFSTGLSGIDCWSAGACVAVGEYGAPSSDTMALVAPISGGQPGGGLAVTLPSDVNIANPISELNSVRCWSAGSCVAVGQYYTGNSEDLALVVPISGSAPAGTGIKVTLPDDANAAGQQNANLTDVKCWSGAQCVAVGNYYDTSDNLRPLVVPITNGTPGSGVGVAFPGDPVNPYAALAALSCSSTGACYAVGNYSDASGSEGLVLPIDSGSPGTPVKVTLPAGGTNGQLLSISCSSAANCTAVGDYEDAAGDYQGMLVPITDGTVGAAVEVASPSNPAGSGQHQYAALQAISCTPTGDCVAAGNYLDASNVEQGLLLTISNGAAGSATEATLPTDASPTSANAYLSAVTCDQSGSCLAVGQYQNQAGKYVPLQIELQAPLAVDTATLPASTVGSTYQQTLAASGAWGSYSWSVTSGSLPAGLSLNSQTGVISGTPTSPGAATFTVQATGTGVPVQTATQQLSIAVAAAATPSAQPPAPPAAAPHVTLAGGLLQVRAGHVLVTIRCTDSLCQGSIRIEVRETFTVKHGHRRVHRHRLVVIGNARFTLTQGAHHVKVVLNATGRRLLARARHHRLPVRVLAAVVQGNRTTHGATIR